MFEQLSKRALDGNGNGDGNGKGRPETTYEVRWRGRGGEGKTCGMACGRIADKLQFVQIFMYIENYSFV